MDIQLGVKKYRVPLNLLSLFGIPKPIATYNWKNDADFLLKYRLHNTSYKYNQIQAPNLIPPSENLTKNSSTGSYKNLACKRSGVDVLSILKLVKKPIIISLVSISARYFPIQLLWPAEKGINEYGYELYIVLSFHLSGLKT